MKLYTFTDAWRLSRAYPSEVGLLNGANVAMMAKSTDLVLRVMPHFFIPTTNPIKDLCIGDAPCIKHRNGFYYLFHKPQAVPARDLSGFLGLEIRPWFPVGGAVCRGKVITLKAGDLHSVPLAPAALLDLNAECER